MFTLFQRCFLFKEPIETAQSYVGVAASGYGVDYDLFPLLCKELDEYFKDDFYFNLAIGNKRFTDFEQGRKHANRRGVTSHSAYLIGLKCPIDQIDTLRKNGNFSDLIVNITNTDTHETFTKAAALVKLNSNQPPQMKI